MEVTLAIAIGLITGLSARFIFFKPKKSHNILMADVASILLGSVFAAITYATQIAPGQSVVRVVPALVLAFLLFAAFRIINRFYNQRSLEEENDDKST